MTSMIGGRHTVEMPGGGYTQSILSFLNHEERAAVRPQSPKLVSLPKVIENPFSDRPPALSSRVSILSRNNDGSIDNESKFIPISGRLSQISSYKLESIMKNAQGTTNNHSKHVGGGSSARINHISAKSMFNNNSRVSPSPILMKAKSILERPDQ